MMYIDNESQNPYSSNNSYNEVGSRREVTVNYKKYDEATYHKNLSLGERIAKFVLAVFATILVLPLLFAPGSVCGLWSESFSGVEKQSVRIFKEDMPIPARPAVVHVESQPEYIIVRGRRRRNPLFVPVPLLAPRPFAPRRAYCPPPRHRHGGGGLHVHLGGGRRRR